MTIINARCEEELKARIWMAKAAFWQNKEVMRRNVRFGTKKEDNRLLRVFSFELWM